MCSLFTFGSFGGSSALNRVSGVEALLLIHVHAPKELEKHKIACKDIGQCQAVGAT